jgi:hypothetical protein
MGFDLFSWAEQAARQSAAIADSFGIRRVCACNAFWLFHDPRQLLSRFTIIQRNSRWPEVAA